MASHGREYDRITALFTDIIHHSPYYKRDIGNTAASHGQTYLFTLKAVKIKA